MLPRLTGPDPIDDTILVGQHFVEGSSADDSVACRAATLPAPVSTSVMAIEGIADIAEPRTMSPKHHDMTLGPITAGHLAGLPGLRLAVRDALIALQPKTVLEALDITGVGRKTTKYLLAAGIITDPDGVQAGAGAGENTRRR